MNKTEKIIAYIMQQLNQIGEEFGWQIGRVGANWENGYMKCDQDCKAHFRKEKIKKDIEAIINEHIGEVNGKVVTNADRIRAYNDEDLARAIGTYYCFIHGWCDDCPSMRGEWCNGKRDNVDQGLLKWLKEKVE